MLCQQNILKHVSLDPNIKIHSSRNMTPVPGLVRGISVRKELSFEKLIENIVTSFITTTGNLRLNQELIITYF